MKKVFLFTLFCIFTVTGCYNSTVTDKEAEAVEKQLAMYTTAQPTPSFLWSFERELVIELFKARNKVAVTHTVWRSDYGMIEGDCKSLGYGIPYDVSLTNPLQIQRRYIEDNFGKTAVTGVVEQQEPNGIFTSKTTSATWVLSIDPETGGIEPIYVESKVTVYPYPVEVDYKNNRVLRAGKSTISFVIPKN